MIRVYVVATGFGMLFYRKADISSHLFQACVQSQTLPTSFTFSPMYANDGQVPQLTLFTILFNCSFVGWSLGFLKTRPNVFSALKDVLIFPLFKILLQLLNHRLKTLGHVFKKPVQMSQEQLFQLT